MSVKPSSALFDTRISVQNKKARLDSARASGEAWQDSSATSWPVCNVPSPELCLWLTQIAIFGLPGYFLKGIERAFLRRHLTALQAEIVLIQLRRSAREFRRSSEAERAEVLGKWNDLQAHMTKHGQQ